MVQSSEIIAIILYTIVASSEIRFTLLVVGIMPDDKGIPSIVNCSSSLSPRLLARRTCKPVLECVQLGQMANNHFSERYEFE
jgi:hypothetical protein